MPSILATSARVAGLIVAPLLFATNLLLGQAQPGNIAPQRTVRVVGRVTGDDPAVPHASVAVTIGDRRRFARTDDRGAYNVRFDSVSRAVTTVTIATTAIGYRPLTQTAALPADSAVVHLDVAMTRNPTRLASVKVTGKRQRPGLGDASRADVGAASDVAGDEAAVGLADRGNLDALAASLPGVTPVTRADGSAAGFSVLGTAAAQSNVTLNGLAFDGAALPKGAFVSTRLSTSPYDPMTGGFSGGQLAVRVSPGSNYTFGGLMATLDDPHLQAVGPSARALGGESRMLSVSGTRSGPIVMDKSFYNIALQLDHRETPLSTLGSGAPAALDRMGLTPAAFTQLSSALDRLGVPHGPAFDTRRNTGVSLLGRMDLAPTATRAFNVTFNAQERAISGFAGPADGLTANRPTSTRASAALQSDYSRFIGDRYTFRSRTGVSLGRDRLDAGAGPSGHVLVASTQSDGAMTFSDIAFGRGDAVVDRSARVSGETLEELSWFARGTSHQVKIGAQLRAERSSWTRDIGMNGRWSFASVADLAAGQPTSFVEALDTQRGNVYAAGGAVGIGDFWRLSPRLQVQTALRVEGDVRGPGASDADLVEAKFGRAVSARAPGFAVLPRFGFTWAYGSQEGGYGGSTQPRGMLRGGVGAYRSWLGASSVQNALSSSGDPARLVCVGELAPIASWTSADVTGASCATTSQATTSVTTFADGFSAPTSWRGTLGWSGPVLGLRLGLDAVYSLNLHQTSFEDLNFGGAPQFTLAEEGGRRVFAPADRIASSGAADPLAVRRDSTIGTIGLLTSDLRGETTQLRASVSSDGSPISSAMTWSLSYAFTDARNQTRGFDAPTANDPREVRWSPSALAAPHQFIGTLGWRFGETGYLNATGQVRAGTPFTPMVVGDVNGDGRYDDPAFIFDPSRTSDAAVARSMSSLLANAPSRVRECLTRQLGQIALANSCAGSWTFDGTVQASFSAGVIGLPKRARLIYTLSNPAAGLDHLLHGDNTRGWGSGGLPDSRLLAITGFDQTTQRYHYVVNDAFGTTTAARFTMRNPSRLTVEVYLPLGKARDQQLLAQVFAPGRTRAGNKLTAAQIKSRFIYGVFIDPVRVVIGAKDSLLLSDTQRTELDRIGTRYLRRLDSTWTPVAQSLADEGPEPDVSAATQRVRAAQDQAWSAMADAARAIRALLSPEQLDLLTPEIQEMLTDAGIARARRLTQTAF